MFIGNYKILGQLGCGGTCAVHLCEHQENFGLYAIKIMNDNFDAEEFFENETSSMKDLNHPNILRMIDYGQ